MTLDFKEEEIKEKEIKLKVPFAGYLSPQGELIDFSTPLGESLHNSISNQVAQTYLKYISYIITGDTKDGKYAEYLKKHKPEKIKEMLDDDLDELIYRGYASYYSNINKKFEDFYNEIQNDLRLCELRINKKEEFSYDRFKLDLLKFFLNAYKNGSYLKSVGKITRVDNQIDIEKRLKKEFNLNDDDRHELLVQVERTVSKELLTGFKDICVQYMGYDSIERFDSNARKIDIPAKKNDYDLMFYSNPRVISTSHKDIYDRFYNYILMDWNIYQAPRYLYNGKTGIYEPEPDFVNSHIEESNKEIKNEIESIKRLVPLKERKKYFK